MNSATGGSLLDVPRESRLEVAFTSTDLRNIPLGDIVGSPLNPRSIFEQDEIDALAGSIQTHGLMQPLVVRSRDDNKFEIIAGHRRYRALVQLGMQNADVIVRPNVSDVNLVEMALVENLLRKNLDPIEEAEGYQKLRDLGREVIEIAARVKRSQPAISNALRLLRLPEAVRDLIRLQRLTASHGVALVGLADNAAECIRLANAAIEANWTTKHLESVVQAALRAEADKKNPPIKFEAPAPAPAANAVPSPPPSDESTEEGAASETARAEALESEALRTVMDLAKTAIEKAKEEISAERSHPVPLATPSVPAPSTVPPPASKPAASVTPTGASTAPPPPAPTPTPKHTTPTPIAAPTGNTTPPTAPQATPDTASISPQAQVPGTGFVNMMIPAEIHSWLMGEHLTPKSAISRFREMRQILTEDAMTMIADLAAHLADKLDKPIGFPEALESTLHRRCVRLGLRPMPDTEPVGTPEDESLAE